MIFLSHTGVDKPVVEPIAIRLRDICGQDKIFYDSWSIQPGDGIIQKMNEGLTAPQFVFFFVSEKSLNSPMVKTEWQTALMKATQSECKIIPVRVDSAAMPALLMQNLYIDMHTQGMEAAILNIVNVVQGNNTFTPQHQEFSNLTYAINGDPAAKLTITISASHLMEPNPSFLIMFSNNEGEYKIEFENKSPLVGGFAEDIKCEDGKSGNVHVVKPMGGAITPNIPMKIVMEATSETPLNIVTVMHQSAYEQYSEIPRRQ